MEQNKRKVSVIIPTYSRPNNLKRAIESVLSQTYGNIELIVVDDNGEGTQYQKETELLLSSYIENKQVKYIKHKHNRNGSAARNTGVHAADGSFICLLDDDDEFLPNKISIQVQCLELAMQQNEKVKGCYCNLRQIGYNRKVDRINQPTVNLQENLLLNKVEFNSSTIMIDKDAYLSIGGFDERYKRHQDLEFYMRFLNKYNLAYANPSSILVIKHQSPNVITRNPYKSIEYLEFFIENFKSLIDKFPNSNRIYSHMYIKIACTLLRSGNHKDGFMYFRKAVGYRMPSLIDLAHFIYSFFVNKV